MFFGYKNKEKFPIYVSQKRIKEKHVDLLLILEENKRTLCYYQRFYYIYVSYTIL